MLIVLPKIGLSGGGGFVSHAVSYLACSVEFADGEAEQLVLICILLWRIKVLDLISVGAEGEVVGLLNIKITG